MRDVATAWFSVVCFLALLVFVFLSLRSHWREDDARRERLRELDVDCRCWIVPEAE